MKPSQTIHADVPTLPPETLVEELIDLNWSPFVGALKGLLRLLEERGQRRLGWFNRQPLSSYLSGFSENLSDAPSSLEAIHVVGLGKSRSLAEVKEGLEKKLPWYKAMWVWPWYRRKQERKLYDYVVAKQGLAELLLKAKARASGEQASVDEGLAESSFISLLMQRLVQEGLKRNKRLLERLEAERAPVKMTATTKVEFSESALVEGFTPEVRRHRRWVMACMSLLKSALGLKAKSLQGKKRAEGEIMKPLALLFRGSLGSEKGLNKHLKGLSERFKKRQEAALRAGEEGGLQGSIQADLQEKRLFREYLESLRAGEDAAGAAGGLTETPPGSLVKMQDALRLSYEEYMKAQEARMSDPKWLYLKWLRIGFKHGRLRLKSLAKLVREGQDIEVSLRQAEQELKALAEEYIEAARGQPEEVELVMRIRESVCEEVRQVFGRGEEENAEILKRLLDVVEERSVVSISSSRMPEASQAREAIREEKPLQRRDAERSQRTPATHLSSEERVGRVEGTERAAAGREAEKAQGKENLSLRERWEEEREALERWLKEEQEKLGSVSAEEKSGKVKELQGKLKKEFRRLKLLFHPDKQEESQRGEATEIFAHELEALEQAVNRGSLLSEGEDFFEVRLEECERKLRGIEEELADVKANLEKEPWNRGLRERQEELEEELIGYRKWKSLLERIRDFERGVAEFGRGVDELSKMNDALEEGVAALRAENAKVLEMAREESKSAREVRETAERANETAERASETAERANETAERANETAERASETAERALEEVREVREQLREVKNHLREVEGDIDAAMAESADKIKAYQQDQTTMMTMLREIEAKVKEVTKEMARGSDLEMTSDSLTDSEEEMAEVSPPVGTEMEAIGSLGEAVQQKAQAVDTGGKEVLFIPPQSPCLESESPRVTR